MSGKRIIVIGAGAAGLMAAGQAALNGAEVLVLEKKLRTGRKLRITGKGRCNLTNDAPLRDFLAHFNSGGKFLRQAFARFFAPDLVRFFNELGIETTVERGGRIFPSNNDAVKLTEALNRWARACGVAVRTSSPVEALLTEKGRITGVQVPKKSKLSIEPPLSARSKRTRENARLYRADAVILAAGGKSYPATGSTGDGYRLAKTVGHTVVPARPSLVPIETKGDTASRLQGLSLKNVSVTVWIDRKMAASEFGEMLFTDTGMSGPIILNLSRLIVDACIARHNIELSIDLKPALDEQKLDARLLRDFETHGKQQFHTVLKGLLPHKLIAVCVNQTGIDPDKTVSQITSEERKRLMHWLKDFCFEVAGYRGFSEAIITAGGIRTNEIDPRTMESKLIKGLYFAGEVIDIDADTGGYNLQAAFSTGWLAGNAAAGKSV